MSNVKFLADIHVQVFWNRLFSWHRSYETLAGYFSLTKALYISNHTTLMSSFYFPDLFSICLSPFLSSFHSVHLSSPLLSLTCSYYKGAQMPQISSTDLLQQKGDPRGIRLTNHCLKPLWAHRPRDKDSRELYSALAGISGCLCWDWQARLFLRWKIAAGQPTASCLSISQSEKFQQNLWDKHKGMSPLSWRDARCTAG